MQRYLRRLLRSWPANKNVRLHIKRRAAGSLKGTCRPLVLSGGACRGINSRGVRGLRPRTPGAARRWQAGCPRLPTPREFIPRHAPPVLQKAKKKAGARRPASKACRGPGEARPGGLRPPAPRPGLKPISRSSIYLIYLLKAYFFAALAQESFNPTIRLNTLSSAVESSSFLK